MSDGGLSLLESRCRGVPDVLRSVLAAPLPSLRSLARRERWVVTGIGGSEGPARVFAALLRRHLHVAASFVPLSAFAPRRSADVTDPSAVLAVFTQGVSPNARLALASLPSFGGALVVTGTPDDPGLAAARDLGAVVASHPPGPEPGLLVRIQGPAAATMLALRLVDALAEVRGGAAPFDTRLAEAIPAEGCVATPLGREERALVDAGCVALVTSDAGLDLAQALRWKWLEGAGTCDPPVWDALQFAHGPLQHVWDRPKLLLALGSDGDDGAEDLRARLESLVDGRAPVRRLVARHAGALGFFDLDAQVNGLVVEALRGGARDLARWPGQGRDGALYGLGAAEPR